MTKKHHHHQNGKFVAFDEKRLVIENVKNFETLFTFGHGDNRFVNVLFVFM
jgi:hypothetical protein